MKLYRYISLLLLVTALMATGKLRAGVDNFKQIYLLRYKLAQIKMVEDSVSISLNQYHKNGMYNATDSFNFNNLQRRRFSLIEDYKDTQAQLNILLDEQKKSLPNTSNQPRQSSLPISARPRGDTGNKLNGQKADKHPGDASRVNSIGAFYTILDSSLSANTKISLLRDNRTSEDRVEITNFSDGIETSYFTSRFTDTSILHFSYSGNLKSTIYLYGNSGRLWKMNAINGQIDILRDFTALQQIDKVVTDSTGKRLLVIGGDSVTQFVYCSNDSGKTWQPVPVTYRTQAWARLSNPVFVIDVLLVCLLTGITLLAFWRRSLLKDYDAKKPPIAKSPLTVITDNPNGKDDLDVLGFKTTRDAIISLIKNRDTHPPMSIIISSAWGGGKSSMMASIKETLNEEPDRFTTVWFNVWHMQGDNNLLSVFVISLMNNIKTGFGGWFRLRLFINRLFALSFLNQLRSWLAVGIFLPLLVLGIIALINPLIDTPNSRIIAENMAVLKYYYGFLGWLVHSMDGAQPTDSLLKIASALLIGTGGIISALFLHRQVFTKIGSSFIDIIPYKEFIMQSAHMPPGFRDNFKREFWEVISAAGPSKKIVIFIDDIDRVTGDKVLQLLETINFISDTASRPDSFKNVSSNLFFIIAMATDEVAQNLGAQLQTINKSTVSAQILGARFLEKMVDLSISLPSVEDVDGKTLMQIALRPAKNDNNVQTD